MIEYKNKDTEILKDGHTMFTLDVVRELNRKAYLEEKYQELLYQVQNKIEGETRHESAKRIIRDSHNNSSSAATEAWIDNLPD